MYAKVFEQIFDSSISKDYTLRHVFMDLLVLADLDGVVDKTHDAIARRLNMPEDLIRKNIKKLMEADPASRTPDHDGSRLVPLDDRRDWGWRIVNYEHYKRMRDEEGRRSYMRDLMRDKRIRDKKPDGEASIEVFMAAAPKILEFLNQKAGTEFRMVPGNLKHIAQRLQDGHTDEDCFKVIQSKVAEWGEDPKMKKYLRPSTLFRQSKFEEYLGLAKQSKKGVYVGLNS
jgi:uncharacterized phage protein (TIGR02220 family)